MARPYVVGLDAKFYVNVARGTTPPVYPWSHDTEATKYTEVPTTRDVTLNLSSSSADATTRGGGGWRQNVMVIREASIDSGLLWVPPDDPTADPFGVMMNAYLNGCPLDFLILDGPVAGLETPDACGLQGKVTGLRADFNVTEFTRNEGMEDVLTADITLEVSPGILVPEWIWDIRVGAAP